MSVSAEYEDDPKFAALYELYKKCQHLLTEEVVTAEIRTYMDSVREWKGDQAKNLLLKNCRCLFMLEMTKPIVPALKEEALPDEAIINLIMKAPIDFSAFQRLIQIETIQQSVLFLVNTKEFYTSVLTLPELFVKQNEIQVLSNQKIEARIQNSRKIVKYVIIAIASLAKNPSLSADQLDLVEKYRQTVVLEDVLVAIGRADKYNCLFGLRLIQNPDVVGLPWVSRVDAANPAFNFMSNYLSKWNDSKHPFDKVLREEFSKFPQNTDLVDLTRPSLPSYFRPVDNHDIKWVQKYMLIRLRHRDGDVHDMGVGVFWESVQGD